MKPLTREYFLEAAESYDGNGLAEECMLPTGPMLALFYERDTLRAELEQCRKQAESLFADLHAEQLEHTETVADLEQCRKERDANRAALDERNEFTSKRVLGSAHRCDAYGLSGLPGVTFCRKGGARIVAEKLEALSAARTEAAADRAALDAQRDALKHAVECENEARAALLASEASRGVLVEALDLAHHRHAAGTIATRQEIESMAAALSAHSHPSEALEKYTAELRNRVLEKVLAVVFLRCQPDHGDLFAEIDDELRALKEKPKP